MGTPESVAKFTARDVREFMHRHYTPRNVIVVAMHGNQTVGLLVQAVSEILSVSRDQIQGTPDIRSDMARASITGVIPIEDGMTRVIDLGAVLQRGGGALS